MIAQAAAKPDRVHDGARHALAELVRAEPRAGGAAERRIELAHLELPERLDIAEVGHVERQDAGMRAPAPRFFLAGALGLVLLVDRERNAPAADAVLAAAARYGSAPETADDSCSRRRSSASTGRRYRQPGSRRASSSPTFHRRSAARDGGDAAAPTRSASRRRRCAVLASTSVRLPAARVDCERS